jgi:hypothetical protein
MNKHSAMHSGLEKVGGGSVFGGTPNTAVETTALPGIADARMYPMKMPRKNK